VKEGSDKWCSSIDRDANRQLAAERILVLDGAMGTMIQALELDEEGYRGARFDAWNREVRGNNDLLILSQPDAIRDIHLAYFRAGADIVSTNTFSSTAIAQADYGMRTSRTSSTSRAPARARGRRHRAAGGRPPRFVAGAHRPTNRTASISPDVSNPGFRAITFDELRDAYASRSRPARGRRRPAADRDHLRHAQRQGGDLRHRRSHEARRRVPVMISGTITDRSGRLLSGQTPAAFWNSVRQPRRSRSANCALGRRRCAPTSPRSRASPTRCLRLSNAGLPTSSAAMTRARIMAELLGEFASAGLVNVVGGCCGTPPDTSAPSRARSPARRRADPGVRAALRLSGSSLSRSAGNSRTSMSASATNVTASARFRKLVTARRLHARARPPVARDQVENGAQIIDVNMDEGLLDSEKAMVDLPQPDRRRARHRARAGDGRLLEVLGDRGRPQMRAGQAGGELDLDEGGRGGFIAHAKIVRRYGAAVVVMAFDEQGQADTLERKTRSARAPTTSWSTRSASRPRTSSSIRTSSRSRPAWRSTTATASPSSRRALDPQNLPHVHISGGVSNLSFSFRGNEPVRQAMHSVFLYHAIKGRHGHGHRQCRQITVYDDRRCRSCARHARTWCSTATRTLTSGCSSSPSASAARGRSARRPTRLARMAGREAASRNALVHGITDFITEDVEEAAADAPRPLA
jgi:5-methyltetrahydrofolate--homocysteine methyltransferase